MALIILVWIVGVAGALAQTQVTVIGTVTPGDCAAFNSTTIIKDAGVVCGGGGGGGSPGGPNLSIQYNNGGSFGGYTITQLTALLNLFSIGSQGLVPASGGGTVNFLRADGTWQPVVIGPGSSVNGDLASFSGTSGNVLQDSGIPAANLVVLSANNTFTGTNAFTGNVTFKSGQPWVDVTAYGAKCDGSTNDATAFQNALNAAVAASAPLQIPNANCLLGANITNSTNFANIIIRGSGNLSQVTFTSTFGFSFTGEAQYFNLTNFAINCGATVCLGITNSTEGAANSYIAGLVVNGGGANGAVFLQNMSQTQFVHNRIITNSASAYGLYIDDTQTSDAGGDLIQSNIIVNINASAGTAAINLVNVGGVRVLDNAVSGYTYGIFNNLSISGGATGIQENNNQLDNLQNGIWFQTANSGITGDYAHVTVSGNAIHASTSGSSGVVATTAGAGAFILDLTITGNIISGLGSDDGILIRGVTNYTITSNAIDEQSTAAGGAIQTFSPGGTCFVIGNIVNNFATHFSNGASCVTSGATN